MKKIFFASILLASCLSTQAATLEGVTMPDTTEVDGKTLALNGQGIRLATFLNVRVYVGGLYLETKSHDGDEILKSPEIKKVQMQFLREVSKAKQQNAWQEHFDKKCDKGCDDLKPQLEVVKGLLKDMKKGDTQAYVIKPGLVEVWIKEKKAGELTGPKIDEFVLSTWIGKSPPNKEIKAGMLGTIKN